MHQATKKNEKDKTGYEWFQDTASKLLKLCKKRNKRLWNIKILHKSNGNWLNSKCHNEKMSRNNFNNNGVSHVAPQLKYNELSCKI